MLAHIEDKQKLNILVSSCDEYADLWDTFFALFHKYWPDCPFPVFLNSVSVPYHSPSIQQILVGSRLGWGDGLLKGLKVLQNIAPCKFTLLFLDDYLINAPVNTKSILYCLSVLTELNGNYLRLIPKPAPDVCLSEYPNIGAINKNSPYRLSLQASIWRTETLLNLLRPAETPWDMEVLGSQRAKKYNGFYCTYHPLIKYLNGVDRGKWVNESVDFLVSEGIKFDEARGIISDAKNESLSLENKGRNILTRFIPLRFRLLLRATYSKLMKKNIK